MQLEMYRRHKQSSNDKPVMQNGTNRNIANRLRYFRPAKPLIIHFTDTIAPASASCTEVNVTFLHDTTLAMYE